MISSLKNKGEVWEKKWLAMLVLKLNIINFNKISRPVFVATHLSMKVISENLESEQHFNIGKAHFKTE